MKQSSTRQKIIDATIELIRTKGYKGATTRSIAEKAGVNEVTIFRNFGSKKGIMEEAIQRFSYTSLITQALTEEATWNLEEDLMRAARKYHEFLNEQRDMVLIGFKEIGIFEELDDLIANIPRGLKGVLVQYFTVMHQKGKVAAVHFEAQAINFIALNFGYFISKARFDDKITTLSSDTFFEQSILLFARGLKP